jgi:hypothetical protein
MLWQKSLDARWGNGFYNNWRGQYFSELHPTALEILTDYVSRLESPWTDIKIADLEGAVSRISETATAYGNRSARFCLVIQARWERNEESAVQIAWAKELQDRLAPYATGVRTRISPPQTNKTECAPRTVGKTIVDSKN